MLARGKYRVHVTGGPKHADGEREIEVKADSNFSFSLPEHSAKMSALTVALTGTALIPAGLWVAFYALTMNSSCFYSCQHDEQRPRNY